MNPDLIHWLNRIGLIMGFISFWFAAPEILGEENLKKLSVTLGASFGCISFLLFVIMLIGSLLVTVVLLFLIFDSLDLDSEYLILFFLIGYLLVIWFFHELLPDITNKFLNLLKRILSQLADDKNFRRKSLFFGGAFFVIGFALQFLGSF